MRMLCLALIVLYVAGCVAPDIPEADVVDEVKPNEPEKPEGPPFHYKAGGFGLASDKCDLLLRLDATYQRAMNNENKELLSKAGRYGNTEHSWLIAYLFKAAVTYANEGKQIAYTTVEAKNPTVLENNPELKWFFSERGEATEWCENTLSYRRVKRKSIKRFLPKDETEGVENVWIPLTLESFDRWYKLLDERVGLEKKFGDKDSR